MRLRAAIFVFFLFLLDLYVFQAFKEVFENYSGQTRLLLNCFYWVLSSICFGYILLSILEVNHSWNPSFNIILRAFVFITIFAKLPVLTLLLLDEFRRLLIYMFGVTNISGGLVERSQILSKVALILGAVPFVSLLYGLVRNPYRYKLHKEKIGIKNLPEALNGLKLVQISDIHSGSFTFKEPVKRAVEIINEQKADFVFFTGDMVNSIAEEMERFVDVFDKIKSKYGTFSVKGNHDYGDYHRWASKEEKRANNRQFEDIQKRMGWDLLMNENRVLDVNGEKVAIIGVENISGKIHFSKYGDLNKAYGGCEECPVKILLSHDPSHWTTETTKKYKDIDLTLSGHTHGMQFGIEIPGWLKWSPIQYIYKQWAGLYKEGEQYLYVNRGLGFLGYPGRVGILPEITLLELETT